MNNIKLDATEKISIITVVFNDVNNIQKTILSVINQSYNNIEYIVIDGGSTDGTLDILNQYKDKISVLISEKDNGIYDAMNKGIKYSTGDWVLFMNCGDYFYSRDSVKQVFTLNLDSRYDIILGSAYVHSYWGDFYLKVNKENKIWKRFVHQSLFSRRSLNLEFPFDLEYKSAADFNFVYKCIIKNKKILSIDIPISTVEYATNSHSTIYEIRSKYEVVKTIISNITIKGFFVHFWYHLFALIRVHISKILRKLSPKLVNKYRIYRDNIKQ